MKHESENSGSDELQGLLRAARPSPPLPPRFQENVWRRIERAEARPESSPSWLDHLAAWLLHPRLAMAGAVALLLLGSVWGAWEGMDQARASVRTRYVASVSPDPLR
jgi:hypothetical protein